MEIIQEVAKCMPENYVVDLDDPEVFVLVEVFKVRGPCFGRDAALILVLVEYLRHEHGGRLLSVPKIQCHGTRECA